MLPVTFERKVIFENVKINGNVGKVEIMNEKRVIFFDRCRKHEGICNFFLRYVTQCFHDIIITGYESMFLSAKYFISKDKIIPSFFFFLLC